MYLLVFLYNLNLVSACQIVLSLKKNIYRRMFAITSAFGKIKFITV